MIGYPNDYATLEEVQATLQKETEYIDEQGIIRCKMCNGEKIVQNPFTGHYHRVVCDCIKKANDEAEKKAKRQAYLARLRERSLLNGKYENARFENAMLDGATEEYKIAFRRCKKYASIPDTILEKGYGLYLYGDYGSGKTYLSACIANELLDKGYLCIFTNMIDVSQWIRSTYGKYGEEDEESIVDKLSSVDFLFIDDIGTERYVDNNGNENWLQEIIYTIFNNRDSNKKPTIFTSNIRARQLETRGLTRKIVDRIVAITYGAIIEVKGNLRKRDAQSRAEDMPF